MNFIRSLAPIIELFIAEHVIINDFLFIFLPYNSSHVTQYIIFLILRIVHLNILMLSFRFISTYEVLFVQSSFHFSWLCQYSSMHASRLIRLFYLIFILKFIDYIDIQRTYTLICFWLLWLLFIRSFMMVVWNLLSLVWQLKFWVFLFKNYRMHSVYRAVIVTSREKFLTFYGTCYNIAN